MIPTHNTRTGAETLKLWVDEGAKRLALVAATPADARDVMIEGESGLLNIYPEKERPLYQSSKRRLSWPNGAQATIYSAHKHEDKSGLRGPQHEKAWGDEPAKWQYPGNLQQLLLGMRLGASPQVVLTGTPRAIPMIRDMVRQAQKPESHTKITVGTTYENQTNLSPSFFEHVINMYAGTRLGEQEIMARLLDEVQGALWTCAMLEGCRSNEERYDDDGRPNKDLRDSMERVVVAVDPSVSDATSASEQNALSEKTAECGIMVAGRRNGIGHLLDDCSLYAHPSKWAQRAVDAYRDWNADYIVAEQNNGGELVRIIINSVPGAADIPVRLVTASRGKYTRAEPVALYHERGFIKHHGTFPQLEDQLTGWVPGEKSPDRLDAYVWAFSELLVGYLAFDVSGGRDEKMQTAMSTNGGGQQVDSSVLSMIKRNGLFMP